MFQSCLEHAQFIDRKIISNKRNRMGHIHSNASGSCSNRETGVAEAERNHHSTPKQNVNQMMHIINRSTMEDSGKFFRKEGTVIPIVVEGFIIYYTTKS
jgi:hypothetical protein